MAVRKVSEMAVVKHPLVLFVATSILMSWAFWSPILGSHVGLLPQEIEITSVGGFILYLIAMTSMWIAALPLVAAHQGTQGVKDAYRNLLSGRNRALWYAVAMLIPVAIEIVPPALYASLSGSPAFSALSWPYMLFVLVLGVHMALVLALGGTGYALQLFVKGEQKMMNVRSKVLFGLRIMISAFLLFALYSIDIVRLSLSEAARSAPATLLLVSLLQAAVLSYPIARARWSGWRLVGAIFLLFYGVTTIMVAIEAVYLPGVLPGDLVLHLLVNGAFTAAIFSPIAVLLHGRMRSRGEPEQKNSRLVMPWYQWLLRCALIALSWAVIFVLFGALVYLPLAGALDPSALQASANPDLPMWVLPFQMLRALLWTALTLPIIRMTKGGWWETAFIVALSYCVLMGSNLLMPTDMSPGLQLAHLIEVVGEAFVFGWIVVGLLHCRTERPARRLASSVSRQA